MVSDCLGRLSKRISFCEFRSMAIWSLTPPRPTIPAMVRVKLDGSILFANSYFFSKLGIYK